MSKEPVFRSVWCASADVGSEEIALVAGRVSLFSAPAELAGRINEDAAGVWETPWGAVLAVADGMGGQPGGADAAAMAIEVLDSRLSKNKDGGLRAGILDAFEAANREILDQGSGGGTTLVVAQISDRNARIYHAGDSGAVIVGQRGRLRFESVNHSPCGFAVAAGILDREDVPAHPERHFLSNHVGTREMHIEVGPPISLAPFDTVLLASDGVLDNISHDRLINQIRSGPLSESANGLRDSARSAMRGELAGFPAYPDDATAILFRRGRGPGGKAT